MAPLLIRWSHFLPFLFEKQLHTGAKIAPSFKNWYCFQPFLLENGSNVEPFGKWYHFAQRHRFSNMIILTPHFFFQCSRTFQQQWRALTRDGIPIWISALWHVWLLLQARKLLLEKKMETALAPLIFIQSLHGNSLLLGLVMQFTHFDTSGG